MFVGLVQAQAKFLIFHIFCQAELEHSILDKAELGYSILDKAQLVCLQPYFQIVVPTNYKKKYQLDTKTKKKTKKKKIERNFIIN